MQQGIAQLRGAPQAAPQAPQQQPMMAPGQAMPAQVMPAQQPPTPQVFKSMLDDLPPQTLISMWANPLDKTPKWAVMTAYAKAVEQARLEEQAKGQQAMAQSQSMQGSPTIAQAVMSQPLPGAKPVMAAHGGIMRGYAGGGAVAFQSGGYAPDYQDARRFGIDLSPYDPPEVRAEKLERVKRMREFEAQMAGRRAEIPTEAGLAAAEAASETQRLKSRPTNIMGEIGPAAQPAPRPSGGQPMGQPPARPAERFPISGDVPPEIRSAIEARIASLQNRQRPEGLLALERQMAEQAKANIEAQRAEKEQFGRESRQGLEDVLARTRGAPSGMELLRVAAGIDTRKRGAGLGSLFGGVSDVMGQRQAAEEAARKDYRTAQATERQMAGALRQIEALEVQRQFLLANDRFKEANQVQDQIDTIKEGLARFGLERKDKAIEQERQRELVDIERAKVRAAEAQAGATRESATLEKYSRQYNAVLGAMQAQESRIRKDHAEQNKFIYQMATMSEMSGAPLKPEQKAQLDAANKSLADKLAKLESAYAPQLQQLSQKLGTGTVIPWDTIK